MKIIPATTTIGVSLFLLAVLFIVPALAAATTSVQIIKYADDGSTILNQTTVDFQWMETHLPVYGDGVTHYYHQGPVFNDSIPDKWNPEENDPAILTKDYGALKGTDLKDLCDLVGGMQADDYNVTLKASDGFSKAFAYSSVYNPPARAGPIVLTWYRADQGYVNGSYTTGIRNVMFADTSTNPWGDHVFGLWDMHEAYPEAFWYYYQPGLPSTTGLSVQNIAYVLIYSSIPPPEMPSANYTAIPVSGTVPLMVQFTDTSLNDPTSWAWDFDGDGDIDSTAQSPAFTYTIPGSYSVNLTVANAAGSDSEVKEGYINAFVPTNATPVISFVPASASVLPGGSMEYQIMVDTLPKGLAGYDLVCTVSNTSVAEILSVSYPSWAGLQNTTNYSAWSVRLSGVDTGRQIQPGAMNVILANVTFKGDVAGETPIVISNVHMDADGGDAINTSTNNGTFIVNSVPPAPPVANFTGTPRSGNAPLLVQFTDTSTGGLTSWAWDFNNDGVIDNTTRNPTYTYLSPGTYSVNLTVTNAGGSDNELKTNYITVQAPPPAPPVANFTGTPRSGTAPLSVQFTDTSSGSPTSWAWDFNNDGVIDNTSRNPMYTYQSQGTYSVNLTVTNAGGSDNELKTNYITVQAPPPAPPVANFTGTPRSGTAPLSVQFTDTSTGSPTSWSWDFNNDGVIDNTTRNPTYTYLSPGTYSVSLTVTNAGGSDSELKTNYITVQAPPVANFTGVPRSGNAPLSVQFTDTSTGGPTTWAWDFNNDGIIDNTTRNPTYTYLSPGTYSVNLTVTNAGGSDSELKTNYITVQAPPPTPPVANFTGTPRSGNAPLSVQFTDTSNVSPTSWAWDFNNDGVIDNTSRNPMYTYQSPGTYSVNLTVTNEGGSDSELKTNYIMVQAPPPAPPVANFTGTPRSGNAPLSVQFTDTSTGGPTSWSWDFNNDGVIDNTSRNPMYTYLSPGTYSVNLSVTNAGGSDNELKMNYIAVQTPPPAPPVANFTGTPRSGNAPLSVQFTDTSTGGPISWAWDFNNDGVIDNTSRNPTYTYLSPGTYSVNLSVTNAGGSDSELKMNYITVQITPSGTASVSGWVASGSDIGSVYVPGIRVRFATSVSDLSNPDYYWEATTDKQGTYSISGLPSGVTLYAAALPSVARPNAYLERPVQYQIDSGRLIACPNVSSIPQVPPIASDGKMQVNWILTQNSSAFGLFFF